MYDMFRRTILDTQAGRRLLVAAVLLPFVFTATGAALTLHHHCDDHGAASAPTCQVCYLIAVSSVALAAIALLFLTASSTGSRPAVVHEFIRQVRHGQCSAAPRAPPC